MSEMRKIEPKSDEYLGAVPTKKEPVKVYPRFRIELSHLPEAKKWDIGKTYEVTLKMTMTGISISRFQNDAEFDIKAMGVGKAVADEKEEKAEK